MGLMSQSALAETDRTKLRRKADRGTFDRAAAHAILDEAYLAHVGFVVDGEPRVLPMTYGRDGDVLFLHGAAANGMLKAASGTEVCVTVTLLDGLVLARSAFHHSMNYRSVVLVGRAEKVADPVEKRHALGVIVEHVLPGRGAEADRPTTTEAASTWCSASRSRRVRPRFAPAMPSMMRRTWTCPCGLGSCRSDSSPASQWPTPTSPSTRAAPVLERFVR